MQRKIVRRTAQAAGNWSQHIPEVIRRVMEHRGIGSEAELDLKLQKLLHPTQMGSMLDAARIMADAIIADKHIMIAGDYDCDGATGAATAYKGLRMLGAKRVRFIVPDRFIHGYGLSPELIDAMHPSTELIVTVDSGVASVEGVAHAKAKGMIVVITDHHLPGDVLPNADAIVNPNLRDDGFPSKALAGVGVMFYLLIAIRAHLRERCLLPSPEPDLTELLDLVALGTIADLVPLDFNNRIIVDAGLRRIRAGKVSPGVKALIEIGGREPEKIVASDFGFAVGPRLNAAGRLENMRLGVETLISENAAEAREFAAQLDAINMERKDLQAEMIAEAETIVSQEDHSDSVGVVVFDPGWHSGVVGLVASRLKENLHRPVVALAPSEPGSAELRGSARSIEGFHLRDALALLNTRYPGLMTKFGGHAMAAGLSMSLEHVDAFTKAFNEVAIEMIAEEALQPVVYSDGELSADQLSIETARQIESSGPWGQAFPQPVFDNIFYVNHWRTLKDVHLKVMLEDPRSGNRVEAIMFSAEHLLPPPLYVRVAYELGINSWKGRDSLQLMLKHMEPAQLL